VSDSRSGKGNRQLHVLWIDPPAAMPMVLNDSEVN
ncbi:unnamed protein product, partial [marine sediment metagenome]